MNPEILRESGQLINQFGFPIFVGVVMLAFFTTVFFMMFRYFTNFIGQITKSHSETCEKKDADLMAYVDKRDTQFCEVVNSTNAALGKIEVVVRENTLATNKATSFLYGAKKRTPKLKMES